MSAVCEVEYRKAVTHEMKVDKYTYRVVPHFRKRDAPHVDEVIRAFVRERTIRTVATENKKLLS